MSPRYPLWADLAGRPCLVVGGGAVAARKAKGLLEADALVTLVAPRLSPEIEAWRSEGRLSVRERAFLPADVEGATLVFAATGAPEVNRDVAAAARAAGAWVNVADDPQGSDFFVPAVWREGPVALAVASEGASPALSAWLRDRAAEAMPPGIGFLAAFFSHIRPDFGGSAVKEAWQTLLESGILGDLARDDRDALRTKIDERFGAGAYDRIEAKMKEKP